MTIDIRQHPDRLPDAIAWSLRVRPPRTVLLDEVPDTADLIDGHAYIGKVPVTTDPARLPPPRPAPPRPPPEPIVLTDEHRADAKTTLRTQAWEEVESKVDLREMVAHLGVLVGLLLEKATLTAEEGAAIGPALQALGAIQARMESWHVVEETIDAATTFDEVQAVKLPEAAAIPAARAADVAKRLKDRKERG